jgi:hypothetical protein
MKELCTEIEIQAPPEKVWQILSDLEHWSDWNPFIHRVHGKAVLDEKVDIRVRSTASKDMVLHCKVVKVVRNHELSWQYHVLAPFAYRGEHTFRIEPLGENRTRFIDREVFDGLLLPLQEKNIDTAARSGFMDMDKALKARAEAAAS